MCKKLVFLTIATLMVAPAIVNAASQGPVGWWKFDETSGTTAVDSVGGRNGTLLPAGGEAVWAAGKIGGAIQFAGGSGTKPYVELPLSDLLAKLGDSTVTLWVQWAGGSVGSWQRILDFGAGTSVYGFLTSNAGGATSRPRFAIRNVAIGEQTVSAPSGISLADLGWHHMGVGMDRKNMRLWLYMDGLPVANAATQLLWKDLALPAPAADGTQQPWQIWVARSQYPADAYFGGLVDDLRIYDRFMNADDVMNVMSGGLGFGVANSPVPANKATEILATGTTLSWAAGATAVKHDVYFGTDAAALKSVAKGTTATTYNPGTLSFGTTYYWRVDEADANGTVIVAGNVWSFTTELLQYKITSVTPTASSQITGSEATKTTDNSGINASDLAGTDVKTMWTTAANAPSPVWIQYDFDKIYKMAEMWVWNYNSEFESMLGYGLKDVTIETSLDGKTWTKFGDFQFKQSDGVDGYAHGTTINFNGIAAKNVKITANSSWGGLGTYGLSEVRFYSTPSYASAPSPANNATGQRPDITLTWRPGRTAKQHRVFFGTDQTAVTNGTATPFDVTTASFTPADLQLDGTAYYWRVDEFNPAEAYKSWPGSVWKFTTASYLTVDDMEAYADDAEGGRAIYQTWIDGYNSSKNGSQVGYRTAPFAERANVHGGGQSLPFFYTNTKSEPISEATRTFTPAQDWTIGGATTLALFFRPDVNNTGGQLYVRVNGAKMTYNGTLKASGPVPQWKQWNIDLAYLADLVGGLNAIQTLTIGVSDIAQGVLYIDDIRLYRTAPEAIIHPADPGTKNLVSYFNMEGGKVADSISGVTAVNLNATTFVDSLGGFGKALMCSGGTTALNTQFVDIGPEYWDKVVSKLSNCTFSVWVNYTGVGAIWQRVFDFGCGTNVNTYMSTSGATMGIVQLAVKTNVPNAGSTGTGYVETLVRSWAKLSLGWHHLAGVVNNSGAYPTISVYVDGVLASTPVAGRLPKDMVLQTSPSAWQNYFGKSNWPDPYLNGAVDELKVYNRVLTDGEINYLAGGR